MYKKIIIFLSVILILCFIMESEAKKKKDVFSNMDNYHFCHKCGMAVEKNDKVMTITGVKEEPWYQCCPMCALMDIIECGKGDGIITAYGDISRKKIQIFIEDNKIKKIKPKSTILLVGGSCLKNKTFYSKKYALQYIKKNSWAEKKMLKPVDKAFAMLKNKKKAINRCSVCTTKLADHEKTWMTIVTKDKKRMVACCGHCGLFLMYKLKSKVKRAVTPDFKTGRLIDAKKAFYVAGNDMIVCCFPSTISFEKKKDALAFQKKHGGKVITFDDAMKDINKIMKK